MGGEKFVDCILRRILVRDLLEGTKRAFIVDESNYHAIAFSQDGHYLAVASHNRNSARVFNIASGEVLARVPGQRTVAFSPDGRLLATESADVKEYFPVELWDLSAGGSAGRLVGHKGQIISAVFSNDGRFLATGSSDGTARLWDVKDRSEQFVLRAHRAGVTGILFLLNDRSLATASSDGTVKIWDVFTGRQLLSLDVAEGGVSGLTASADGRTLITSSSPKSGERRIDLWTAPAD